MKSQVASAFALAMSLLACAQETPGTHPASAQNASASPTATLPMRIIVQFKSPATPDAQAFVQALQTRTHAPVHYVAAVSADTHVYRLQPQPEQNPAQVLQQLSAMPEISRAELDSKTKAP